MKIKILNSSQKTKTKPSEDLPSELDSLFENIDYEDEEFVFPKKQPLDEKVDFIQNEIETLANTPKLENPFEAMVDKINEEDQKIFESYNKERTEKKTKLEEDKKKKDLTKMVEEILDEQDLSKSKFFAALQKYRTVKSIKARNLGLGEDLINNIDPYDTINFKSLIAGTNIVISSSNEEITISGPAGSGEANTASNIGSGQGLFANKVGVDLRFKTLVAGTNVSLVTGSSEVTINAVSSGSSETTLAANIGSGEGLFANKQSSTLNFRSLVAGANIGFVSGSNSLTIVASGSSGEVNTASNLGTGEGLFANKTLSDLRFRSIKSGTNINVVSGSTDITLNATGLLTSSSGINSGSGQGIYKGNSDSGTLQFRSIKTGLNNTILSGSQEITIDSFPYTEKSSNYTLTISDYTINAISGTPTFTLPSAVGIQSKVFVIKSRTAGPVIVTAAGSETIDDDLTITLSINTSITIQSTGTNWIII